MNFSSQSKSPSSNYEYNKIRDKYINRKTILNNDISKTVENEFRTFSQAFNKKNVSEMKSSIIRLTGILKNQEEIAHLPGFIEFDCPTMFSEIFCDPNFSDLQSVCLALFFDISAQNLEDTDFFYQNDFIGFLFQNIDNLHYPESFYVLNTLYNISFDLAESEIQFLISQIYQHSESFIKFLHSNNIDLIMTTLYLINFISKKQPLNELKEPIIHSLPECFQSVYKPDYAKHLYSQQYIHYEKTELFCLSILNCLINNNELTLEIIESKKFDDIVNKIIQRTESTVLHLNKAESSTYACHLIYKFLEKYHSLYSYNLPIIAQIIIHSPDVNNQYTASEVLFALSRRNLNEISALFQQNPSLFNQLFESYPSKLFKTKSFLGRFFMIIIPITPINFLFNSLQINENESLSFFSIALELIEMESELIEYGLNGILMLFNIASTQHLLNQAIPLFLDVFSEITFFQEIETNTDSQSLILKEIETQYFPVIHEFVHNIFNNNK